MPAAPVPGTAGGVTPRSGPPRWTPLPLLPEASEAKLWAGSSYGQYSSGSSASTSSVYARPSATAVTVTGADSGLVLPAPSVAVTR